MNQTIKTERFDVFKEDVKNHNAEVVTIDGYKIGYRKNGATTLVIFSGGRHGYGMDTISTSTFNKMKKYDRTDYWNLKRIK